LLNEIKCFLKPTAVVEGPRTVLVDLLAQAVLEAVLVVLEKEPTTSIRPLAATQLSKIPVLVTH